MKYILLVDCDSFYCSCEKIFRPDLTDKPVIVLSNNDGCAIALSPEAKAIGFKTGTPYYQFKSLISKHNITIFSSNYELYGDISSRIMNILKTFSPNIEVYSIDEAFLEIEVKSIEELQKICSDIVYKCRKWVGMPVKIGAAHTKTLAKAAAHSVKKDKIPTRYKILSDRADISKTLSSVSISDIWGIGRRITEHLERINVRTASDFITISNDYIKNRFGVPLLRTKMELLGIKSIDLETTPKTQKNMCVSRSFLDYVTEYSELKESVISYTSKASEKLRKLKLHADGISVFIQTNSFNKEHEQYYNIAALTLPCSVNDIHTLVKHSIMALNRIYKKGYFYKKSGILLNDLSSDEILQNDLFCERNDNYKKISETVDKINSVYGDGSIKIAGSGINKRNWHMSREKLSKRFTTSWETLPEVTQ